MFSNAYYRMGMIRSYEEAVKRFDNTKPWRDYYLASEGRPLRDRKDRHLQIFRTADAVRCRLHRTDVVTYHKNGTIELDLSYRSKSTQDFANALLPPGITVRNTSSLIQVGERIYPGGRGVRINLKTGKVIHAAKFAIHTLNRKRCNALLKKHDWAAFRAWRRTMEDVLPDIPHNELRKDVERLFPKIARYSRTSYSGYAPAVVLKWIKYANPSVYDRRLVAYFTTEIEVRRWQRNR